MKRESIYFMQALAERNIQPEKILSIVKTAMQNEVERTLKGALRQETLWISDDANKARRRINRIRDQISHLNALKQAIRLNEDFQRIRTDILEMEARTRATLISSEGPMLADLHIVAKQLLGSKFILENMKTQIYFQLYRLLVLSGKMPIEKVSLPTGDVLEEWIYFYRDQINAAVLQLRDEVLDGRWAYERKQFTLNQWVQIDQFVSVKPEAEELGQVVGGSCVKCQGGNVRISGRGYITNISPYELEEQFDAMYETMADLETDFSFIIDENMRPDEILSGLYGSRKYLVEPSKYFQLINRYLIAKGFISNRGEEYAG